jgi:hypothetical protein
MRNFSRPKPRKIVEISFDPESETQFPQLAPKIIKRKSRNTRKTKSNDKSPTSSHSDSVSAVTRAEFENLSQGIGQLIKNEVQSTLSNTTDQTMMTMFRDEMAANCIESQRQMKIIQTQLTSFQSLINGLMPHLTNSLANSPISTNNSTPTHNTKIDQQPEPNHDKTTDDRPSEDTPTTQPEATTYQPSDNQAEPASPPRIKNVSMSINDQQMPATVSHNAPSASGDMPPPKRRNAGLNIAHMTPLIAQTRAKS